jgi:tellurite resistance protein TerC
MATPLLLALVAIETLLLVFIGVKMLISPFIHLPVTVSLAVIIIVVGGAIAVSLRRDRGLSRPAAGPHRPVRR